MDAGPSPAGRGASPVTAPRLDIANARTQRPYTRAEYAGRVLWALAWPLFRLSPRLCHGWRRALLRAFGARIGPQVHIAPSARIALPWRLEMGPQSSIGDDALVYNLGPVRIGARATVSHLAHLCAGSHDHRQRHLPLLRPPIDIGDDAWICASALVGPGVRVGDGAVVGAAAVAMRDVPAWTIVAGNPARVVGRRELAGAMGGPAT